MNGNIIFASVSVAMSMTMFSHASSHILMTKIIIYMVHGVKMMFGIKQDLYLLANI
jgi:hypothetical protein